MSKCACVYVSVRSFVCGCVCAAERVCIVCVCAAGPVVEAAAGLAGGPGGGSGGGGGAGTEPGPTSLWHARYAKYSGTFLIGILAPVREGRMYGGLDRKGAELGAPKAGLRGQGEELGTG